MLFYAAVRAPDMVAVKDGKLSALVLDPVLMLANLFNNITSFQLERMTKEEKTVTMIKELCSPRNSWAQIPLLHF